MSEMVSRVAKAIYYATPRNKLYEHLAPPHARQWEKRAELAIRAMRDPTHAMEDAGWAHMETGGPFSVFNAMIDKALSKAPSKGAD